MTWACEHSFKIFMGAKKRVENIRKNYKCWCQALCWSEEAEETGQWKKRGEPNVKIRQSVGEGLAVTPEAAGTG